MQIGTSINNRINTYYGTKKPIDLYKKEKETDTDIIVKPDGSRVLIVTVNVGGMKTTMSLEISKPTEIPNDCNNTYSKNRAEIKRAAVQANSMQELLEKYHL